MRKMQDACSQRLTNARIKLTLEKIFFVQIYELPQLTFLALLIAFYVQWQREAMLITCWEFAKKMTEYILKQMQDFYKRHLPEHALYFTKHCLHFKDALFSLKIKSRNVSNSLHHSDIKTSKEHTVQFHACLCKEMDRQNFSPTQSSKSRRIILFWQPNFLFLHFF